MCGIAGVIYGPNGRPEGEPSPQELMVELLDGIKHRGPDAFGWMHYRPEDGLTVQKYAMPPTRSFGLTYVDIPDDVEYVFGHTRYATHGTPKYPGNNHPVKHGKWVAVHNGVLDNYYRVLKHTGREDRFAEVDSEAIPAALNAWGVKKGLKALRGAMATAFARTDDPEYVWLARGESSPLWVVTTWAGTTIFASEKQTLTWLLHVHSDKPEWEGLAFAEEPIRVPEYTLLTYKNGYLLSKQQYRKPPAPKRNYSADRGWVGYHPPPLGFNTWEDYFTDKYGGENVQKGENDTPPLGTGSGVIDPTESETPTSSSCQGVGSDLCNGGACALAYHGLEPCKTECDIADWEGIELEPSDESAELDAIIEAEEVSDVEGDASVTLLQECHSCGEPVIESTYLAATDEIRERCYTCKAVTWVPAHRNRKRKIDLQQTFLRVTGLL